MKISIFKSKTSKLSKRSQNVLETFNHALINLEDINREVRDSIAAKTEKVKELEAEMDVLHELSLKNQNVHDNIDKLLNGKL